jgi:hypothetical protein
MEIQSGQTNTEQFDNLYKICLKEMLRVVRNYDQNPQVKIQENNEQIWFELKTIFQNLSAKYQDAYNKKSDQNRIDEDNGKTWDKFVDENGNYSNDEYVGLPNLAKGEVNFPFNPESPFVIDYIEFVVNPESDDLIKSGNNEFNCPIFFKIRNTQTSYAISIDQSGKYNIFAASFCNDMHNEYHGEIKFFSKEPIYSENGETTATFTFRKFAKIILEFGFAVE